MARMARERGADGVICGHIHHAEIREIEGVTYLNDGDWVESCTALVEHYDGRWEIIAWADLRGFAPDERLAPEPAETADVIVPPVPLAFPSRIPLEATNKAVECEYSSSPTPGTLRSTALFEP